jgi:cyclase
MGYLRTRPMGYKLRRQHPIGIYIVDFYCHTCRLVIEADGSIHNKPDIKNDDHERQVSLENDGLHVIRFTNTDILSNTEHVIEQIHIILTEFQFPL